MNEVLKQRIQHALDNSDPIFLRMITKRDELIIRTVIEACARVADAAELPDSLKADGPVAVQADLFGQLIGERIRGLIIS